MKRFIGSNFDVYFFLWSNGALHWECEKFLWEQEQLREWTYIQSKKQKRASAAKAKSHVRHVHFAPVWNKTSPIKSHPSNSFRVGEFELQTSVPLVTLFGSSNQDLGQTPISSLVPKSQECSSRPDHQPGGYLQNSNPPSPALTCAKCLAHSHETRSCKGTWRCKGCLFHQGLTSHPVGTKTWPI